MQTVDFMFDNFFSFLILKKKRPHRLWVQR